MRRRPTLLLAPAVLLVAACGPAGGAGEAAASVRCGEGLEPFRGRCVDPRARYEPEDRVDVDNVSAFGALTVLDLPDPPKSGFRLVAPPVTLPPGGESIGCVSWPLPSFHNQVVYSSRIYATPGLHHSNMLAKPVDETLGENPYPACHPGASEPFSNIGSGIPDVLFANSTQIVGEEDLVFPEGMGYRLDPAREAVTDIHYLNTTSETEVIEVAYDFFTMPDEDLETEVAPFVLTDVDFRVPPKTTATVEATCKVFGGNVVSFMPHTHQFIKTFSVDFVDAGGEKTQVLEEDGYDNGSDIRVYDPSLDMSGAAAIRFACEYANTTDHDLVYGIGDNEMCILFGYVYPVKSQFAGYVDDASRPCQSFQIGLLRGP